MYFETVFTSIVLVISIIYRMLKKVIFRTFVMSLVLTGVLTLLLPPTIVIRNQALSEVETLSRKEHLILNFVKSFQYVKLPQPDEE